MQKESSLISIITVVYNAINGLEETMLSVLSRIDDSSEYIIVDGGSTDGTVEIIKKYQDRISYWISEPDSGIYDALNKGIKASRGYYLYTLNVGDKLLEIPVTALLEARNNEVDVALFNVELSNGMLFRSKMDFRIRFANTIHHQGAFYRRELNFNYDLKYKVYSDFNLNQKLFLNGNSFARFDKTICYHSLDGISGSKKYFTEYLRVLRNNFGWIGLIFGFAYFKYSNVKYKIFEKFRHWIFPL